MGKDLMKYEKKSIWKKIKENIKKFLNINKKEEIIEINDLEIKEEKVINKNIIIENAKNAYIDNYLKADEVTNEKVVKIIKERIEENKENIKKLIEINDEKITYEKIEKIIQDGAKEIEEYKKSGDMRKIDEKYIFSTYKVPVGIIGIETESKEEIIKNIIKAIVTKNAIIIINEKNEEYSIENLILLIVQEVLNKFEIDKNIIQIINKKEIKKQECDVYIENGGNLYKKEKIHKIYIYLEDEYFKNVVEKELVELKKEGREVEILQGNIDIVIDKINEKQAIGSTIYTKNRRLGYKFVNEVNSENVFMNATMKNIKRPIEIEDIYYMNKSIICEYKK